LSEAAEQNPFVALLGGARFAMTAAAAVRFCLGRTPPEIQNTYKEWDVNTYRRGVNRGQERLVTGSDGSAYYTDNHYKTFVRVK